MFFELTITSFDLDRQVWNVFEFLSIKRNETKELKKCWKKVEILLKIAKFLGENRTKSENTAI